MVRNDDWHLLLYSNQFVILRLCILLIIAALPFFFYYAWLKVGRIAIDPFGSDEDDINILSVFDSHINGAMRLRSCYGTKITIPSTEGSTFSFY